jgi:histidine triad (HIT) family protein
MDESCDFCSIASGAADAEVICEGESWIAFLPPTPATVGHTLVIPRAHIKNILELEPPLSGEMMGAIVRVGRAIEQALRPDGMNLISSAGQAASQTVFHLHFHVVPRRTNDAFGEIWPPKHRVSEETLEDVAELLREHCSSV